MYIGVIMGVKHGETMYIIGIPIGNDSYISYITAIYDEVGSGEVCCLTNIDGQR